MARIISILVLVIACFRLTQGRKCWYCKNEKTNGECLRKGRLQQCLSNQEFCQNEIRAIGGGIHFEITKRCKQDNSCYNNKRQNFTGTEPFQCDTEKPHSVCRCCCGFDNCNGPEVACLKKPPSCSRPADPVNGYTICPDFLLAGVTCHYRCRYGYKLRGEESTKCEIVGTGTQWSNGPPTCEVIPCRALEAPESGSMSCTDDWNIGSECTFDCDPGQVLIGQKVLKCSIFSIWDGEEPECKVVTCLPPRPLDPNFDPPRGECTDGYNYQSTCTFTCHPDYDRVGNEDVVCGLPVGSSSRGRWDRKPPRCRIKICEPRHCSNFTVGGTCNFKCDRCETLVGDPQIQCTRDGWTNAPPTCPVVVCGPSPPWPVNGRGSCSPSDAAVCDDSCEYFCDSGYRMVGPSQTVCLQSGSWSREAPICELSECDRIALAGITATCTNGNIVGSECRLSCNLENQEFVGERQLVCKKDPSDPRPVWDKELNQYCRFILCDPFPRPGEFPDPEAGRLTCGVPRLEVNNDRDGRSGWRVGAQCNIQCNVNYQEKDLVSDTLCTSEGTWTEPSLCCVECLPNPLLDVVVFLDRSESALWNDRLSFLPNFLDFLTFDQSFNLNITFIPFADDVDFANAVEFMPIDDDQNVVSDFDFLTKEFEGLPSAAGQDSNSGKALKEAVDNIFGFHRYRVPMIFLITTRAPSDLQLARRTVQELRDRQIYLRIFPIDGPLSADPGPNRAVFRSLVEADDLEGVVEGAEDEDNRIDFYLTAGDGLITVTQRVCNERAQGLQPCLFA